MSERAEPDPGPQTVSLGRFNPLELPIIIDALREAGIFAMTKSPLDRGEYAPYLVDHGRETLLVERGRVDEANRIIATVVPAEIAEIRDELGADAEGSPED